MLLSFTARLYRYALLDRIHEIDVRGDLRNEDRCRVFRDGMRRIGVCHDDRIPFDSRLRYAGGKRAARPYGVSAVAIYIGSASAGSQHLGGVLASNISLHLRVRRGVRRKADDPK